MTRLSFQDAFFLRAETATTLANVGALMVFTKPDGAPGDYLKRLAGKLGRINETWPVFNRKLDRPGLLGATRWVAATDYDPADHVFHYAIPAPGRMGDLLRLVEHAHEQLLDRSRPLWEVHLIDGLKGGRFAAYFKVHHAVMDGVGGLRTIQQMFSTDPDWRSLGKPRASQPDNAPAAPGALLAGPLSALRRQAQGIPEAVSVLARLGWAKLLGSKDTPLPPYAAPRSLINQAIDGRRRVVVCELPMKGLRSVAKHYKGTVNDVLVSVCGGALREYLLAQNDLPTQSLDAGCPVSVKSKGEGAGNQLSFMVCPFGTDEPDPVRRLRRVIRATRRAKSDIAHMSATAIEDLGTLIMLPYLLMSLTKTSQLFPPVINTIVSNVPGPRRPLYLDGARLERLYPVSVVADSLGLNITAISYGSRLCIAMTACPANQPGIGSLGKRIKRAYRELRATLD